MKEKEIKIVKVEVGEPPKVKIIPNELDALQKEVGGLIEIVYMSDGSLAVVNDEGKINGMEPNRRLGDDIICGPFFICADSQDGEFSSLTETEIKKYMKAFETIPKFTGDEPELEPRATVIGFDIFGGM